MPDGTFTSRGYNLIRIADGSTGFTSAADQTGTAAAPRDAKIGALANNGGPTDTIAPLAGSPVIDKGRRFGLTIDQRGHSRPFDSPDIAPASRRQQRHRRVRAPLAEADRVAGQRLAQR